jgi:hypothetical protein
VCEACGRCGQHGTHNNVCEGCDGRGSLFNCDACNLSHHERCLDIVWGLDDQGEAMSWCVDCFDDWEESGITKFHPDARDDMTIGHGPGNRPDGPAAGTLPPHTPARGRKKTRGARSPAKAAPDLVSCQMRNCGLECKRVTDVQRQKMWGRDHF